MPFRIDIYDNAKIEEILNSEKIKIMVDTAVNAVETFVTNGTISRGVGDEFVSSLKKQSKTKMEELENEKNNSVDKLKKTMSVKIGVRFVSALFGVKNVLQFYKKVHKPFFQTEVENLRSKFEVEKRNIAVKTENLPLDEREEILKLLKVQQQTEMNDLIHKLSLEQEAEIQNLKQQIQAKKEAMLLEIESKLLRQFADDGKTLLHSALTDKNDH